MDRGSRHCTKDCDQDHPQGKEMQKAKWLSEEASQVAKKKTREAKCKGEKERYTHLNAEFQRIASRDKKAFLSDQCKEIEENNRMGKTRDLFRKVRDIKGLFHAKMGPIKDGNGMDLTEAEDIKKRWQEYTEGQYKTDLHDPDNHDRVITYLVRGASSAHGKGHEEGGSAYTKVGSSLRSPPGNSRASTPKTRVCLLSALCFHLHL